MKTDSIFYRLFLEFPSIFFELIQVPELNPDDYEFTSREIKQVTFRMGGLFFPKTEGEMKPFPEVKQLAFRMDGLFFPKTSAGKKPFYLVEVQFQPDDDLYYRIFSELFLYLRQYKPSNPWKVVVI